MADEELPILQGNIRRSFRQEKTTFLIGAGKLDDG
jgi:hypothetical protein